MTERSKERDSPERGSDGMAEQSDDGNTSEEDTDGRVHLEEDCSDGGAALDAGNDYSGYIGGVGEPESSGYELESSDHKYIDGYSDLHDRGTSDDETETSSDEGEGSDVEFGYWSEDDDPDDDSDEEEHERLEDLIARYKAMPRAPTYD